MSDWLASALCRNYPVDLFFPDFNSKGDPVSPRARRDTQEAKKICARCPVAAQCEEDGIDERDGIRFGTTPGERLKLRKTRSFPCAWCREPFPRPHLNRLYCGEDCARNAARAQHAEWRQRSA